MRVCKWDNLPDPRDPNAPQGATCSVVLEEQYLAHFVQKHIAKGDGPWVEWLGAELVEQLTHWLDGEIELTPELREEICRRLREQLEESLRRPLVLLQTVLNVTTWILVVPCGALFILRSKNSKVLMVTTYYPRRLAHWPATKRWRKVVAKLVWRYANLVEVGGCWRLVADEKGPVRWVRLETWGFDTTAPIPVWSGRLQPWPAAEKLSPPQPNRRIKLAPRKWTRFDDWEEPTT